jgi:membrane protein implicated in regulation of membrane protease activity
MSDRSGGPVIQDLNGGLLATAAVLVGVGTALSLAGFALGGAALITAARRWYQRNDLTPVQHAKLTWDQARAATAAGAGAWKGIDKNRYTQSAVR